MSRWAHCVRRSPTISHSSAAIASRRSLIAARSYRPSARQGDDVCIHGHSPRYAVPYRLGGRGNYSHIEVVSPTPITLPPQSRFLPALGGRGPSATFFSRLTSRSLTPLIVNSTPIVLRPQSRSSSAPLNRASARLSGGN